MSSKNSGCKVLITGSNGFIGTNFCDHLVNINGSYYRFNLRDKQWNYD